MMAIVTATPWSSSPDAVAASQHRPLDSIFNTQVIFNRGGRTDDISGYYDMPGFRREMGRAVPAPNTKYATKFTNTGVAPRFQGGNTPSNPGGKNWDTFDRNVRRVTDTAVGLVKFRMQDKRMSLKKTMTNYENAMASWDPANSYDMAYSAAYGAAQPSSAPKGSSATNTSQKTRNPARKSTGPKINSPKP